MKQVLQHARTGEIEVAEVPAPQLLPNCVLVRVAASLVSAGTERASAEFASKNLLRKARSRPDLVRDVFKKIQRDGLLSAVSAVLSRLDQPTALGYSSAGVVVEIGEGISDLKPGDRVACAGAGFAVHAEIACIPRMLVAKIPAETPSSGPVNLASEVARDRGIVVALGTVGMELQRKLYYEKELDFRVSRSYGPGRYDSAFEQKGRDYPLGHVRWTETRNMEAFLHLLADGKLNLEALVTHRFSIENALAAY